MDMKLSIALLWCLMASSNAIRDQKISLLDIEKDNLSNERTVTRKVPPQKQSPSPTEYGFVPIKTPANYERVQPKQQYFQPQYAPQPQQQFQYVQVPQYYYQTQPQIQYVTDNNIAQQPQPQQYYTTPQYVYVQASSNEVQSVVDPSKGGIQYVMYVPSNAESYTKSNEQQFQQQEQQVQNYGNVVYENAAPVQQYIPTNTKFVAASQKEPKSLLDSYVPSVLQLQYYKQQQQAQANALQSTLKLSAPVVGKVEYTKSRPKSALASQRTAESGVIYNYYQLPKGV